MSDEIKDCPFCGSKGIHTPHASGMGGHPQEWGCPCCEIRFLTLEEWNNRTIPTEEVD